MCKWGDTKLVKVPVRRSSNLPTGFEWEEREIDSCIARLIDALNAIGQYTKACCCGHGTTVNWSILFWDGNEMKLSDCSLWKSKED